MPSKWHRRDGRLIFVRIAESGQNIEPRDEELETQCMGHLVNEISKFVETECLRIMFGNICFNIVSKSSRLHECCQIIAGGLRPLQRFATVLENS